MSDYYLHNVDCLEYMRWLPDGAFDVCVTDPPYGVGETNERNLSRANAAPARDYGAFYWDMRPASRAQIDELRRVSREQVIFGGNYFHLPPSPSWIVWDKLRTGDFADCELAWTSHKRAVRKIEWRWNGMIRRGGDVRYHPTQKPLGVMRWIIENYTNPGDTIFDPFMGSGTTGVACMQLGRNFVGCEIDLEYYTIAEKRISEAAKQPPLFVPDEPKEKPKQLNLSKP